VRVIEWEVTALADDEALPYPDVRPYATLDVAVSFVVQVIVAVVADVEDATVNIFGDVLSTVVVKV
jgi:hypothetical protein